MKHVSSLLTLPLSTPITTTATTTTMMMEEEEEEEENNNHHHHYHRRRRYHRIQGRSSRFFLQSPHCAVSRLHHVRSSDRVQSCANHVQHIKHLSRTTCRVTCHVVQMDSSAIKFDKVEITFCLSFLLLSEPLNR